MLCFDIYQVLYKLLPNLNYAIPQIWYLLFHLRSMDGTFEMRSLTLSFSLEKYTLTSKTGQPIGTQQQVLNGSLILFLLQSIHKYQFYFLPVLHGLTNCNIFSILSVILKCFFFKDKYIDKTC